MKSMSLAHFVGLTFPAGQLQPYQLDVLAMLELTRPREISARRARTLRRRGEVCRFERITTNGKARYSWSMATIRPTWSRR